MQFKNTAIEVYDEDGCITACIFKEEPDEPFTVALEGNYFTVEELEQILNKVKELNNETYVYVYSVLF